jgi:hypothetical protein
MGRRADEGLLLRSTQQHDWTAYLKTAPETAWLPKHINREDRVHMIMKKISICLYLFAPLSYEGSFYANEYQELDFIDAHSQADHNMSGINTVLE